MLVLALALWQQGVRLTPDSGWYIRTALSFFHGQGLGLTLYHPAADSISYMPTTHFPPLLPLVYSLGLAAGLDAALVPVLVSLAGWSALLSGMGLLAYRLGGSSTAAVLAVLLAAMTHGFWLVFQHAWSETLFLPLLVWLMVVLVDLPQQQGRRRRERLLAAAMLLAALMLTRYAGVFVYAAVLLWWVWAWWATPGRQVRGLAQDGALLLLAVLPLVGWFLRNITLSEQPVGHHLTASDATFLEGVWAFMAQATTLFVPAWPFPGLNNPAAMALLAAVWLLCFLTCAVLWWRHRPPLRHLLLPHRSPLLLFLLGYSLLYTVVQPFLAFWPIDRRDMTTILCLFQPWLLGTLMQLPVRRKALLLGAFVALNAALAFGPLLWEGWPTAHPSARPAFSAAAAPRKLAFPFWLREHHGYAAYSASAHQHADLLAWLRSARTRVPVLTNEPRPLLFAPHRFAIQGHPFEPPLPRWLDEGTCASAHPLVIVILDASAGGQDAAQLRQAVEQKCPALQQTSFGSSVAYHQESFP
jgi:hypothetical protein